RTLEPFRVAGFQDRCLQPLGHASKVRRTINISARYVKRRSEEFDNVPVLNAPHFFAHMCKLLAKM
ncbi:MAG: hypothetical protein E6850_22480, partial [Leclercia adecarboxylata]|nr:hypothetical protein [Leclercia adecarboxylata]